MGEAFELLETGDYDGAEQMFRDVALRQRDPILRSASADFGYIAIRKGEEDLVKAFNEAIAKILADGTYEKINSQYFDFDVYGRPTS